MLTPLFRSIQKFVLRTNTILPLSKFYRVIYWAGLRIFVKRVGSFPQIEKVYLRRGLTTGDWLPGASDMDLFILFTEINHQSEIEFLRKFWQRYSSLTRLLPFLGEIQIATQSEFNNYTRFGDIRAWEAKKTWVPVYPSKNVAKLAKESYQYSSLKFKLDALTEMLNAYLLFSNAYFGKRTAVSSANYFKSFAGILKYGFYITHGPQELPTTRTAFLSFFSEQNDNLELKRLINKLNSGRKSTIFKADFLLEVYTQILKYLDDVCRLLSEELGKGPKAAFFKEIEYNSFDEGYKKKKIEVGRLFQEVSDQTEGSIQKIILPVYPYLPSCLYTIIDDIGKIERIIRVLRYRTLTDLYGLVPLVLTDNMLDCLTHSLHLETPFNYYSLSNEWVGFPEEELRKPNEHILLLLIRECIANLSISLRMYEHGLPGSSNIYTIYYLFDRILRLHLALEKKIVVSAPLTTLLEVHTNFYPESKEWLENIGKILSLPVEEIEKLDIRRIYYENYPFFNKILKELNKEIFGSSPNVV